MTNLEEGDLVLCTVDRISGTVVFVKIEDDGEGSIVTSEIAPGRIRNLRNYVVPGKKIVCKILRINESGNIHLSLRRVSDKEKREVMEKFQREKTALSILKSVAGKEGGKIAEKLKEEKGNLFDFLQQCKEKPEKLEKYFSKEQTSKICKILQEKREKKVSVKKEFRLKCFQSNGLTKIKQILENKNITYLGSGKYSITIESEDYKDANKQMREILESIEEKSKKEDCEYIVKEK